MRTRSTVAAVVLAVVTLGLLSHGIAASDAPPPATQPVVVRTYDVDPHQIDRLLPVITDIVDQPSWRKNGGMIGAIDVLDHTLVITQTEPNQNAIQHLLEDLRNQSDAADLIHINAYWVHLTPEQLAEVDRASAAVPAEPVANIDHTHGLAQLLDDKSAVYCRARAIGSNHQTMVMTSGGNQDDSTIESSSASNGSRESSSQSNNEGGKSSVDLELKCDYDRRDLSLLVNIKSSVTDVSKTSEKSQQQPATQPVTSAGKHVMNDSSSTALESVGLDQTFTGTARLKPGVPAIIAGMSERPASADQKGMYLVLVADIEKAGGPQ